MSAELDGVVGRAVAHAAGSLSFGQNDALREAKLEKALVASIQAELGTDAATSIKRNSGDLPDWDPKPFSFDARLFHDGQPGSLRAAIECKVEKVEETLWDVYKLVAAAQFPGFEAGYAVVAARTEAWSGAGALLARPLGEPHALSSATLLDEGRAAWGRLLQGGSARPTRVPGRISVTLVAEAPLAAQAGWAIRAVRVAPVPESGWIAFDADGRPLVATAMPGLEAAFAYACHVHAGDLRKGTRIPYISHLLAVAVLVLENGGTEEEAIAALLHDAPEDHGGLGRLADIQARFGDGVADIVASCTDTFESPKPEWRPRKEAYVARLRLEPEPVLRVSLADKLHNARAMARDYEAEGDELFRRFNAGKEEQRWYYGALADVFSERLPDDRLAAEFRAVADRLREAWA
jgi:hypothetical protein